VVVDSYFICQKYLTGRHLSWNLPLYLLRIFLNKDLRELLGITFIPAGIIAEFSAMEND